MIRVNRLKAELQTEELQTTPNYFPQEDNPRTKIDFQRKDIYSRNKD